MCWSSHRRPGTMLAAGWPHSAAGNQRGGVDGNEAAGRPQVISKQGLGSRELSEEQLIRWQSSKEEGIWVLKEEHQGQRGCPPGSRHSEGASEGLWPAGGTLARDFKPNSTCDLY